MIRKIVQYRIQPGASTTVRAAIEEFVRAVAEHEPDAVYGALEAEDGVTFFHCMAFATDEDHEKHRSASYTERFLERLHPLCEEAPVIRTLRIVHSTKQGGGFLGMGKR